MKTTSPMIPFTKSANYLCVPNRILWLVYINTVHFNAVHLLCSALFSTNVVLFQITHCHFALTGSDVFLQPPLLPLPFLKNSKLQTVGGRQSQIFVSYFLTLFSSFNLYKNVSQWSRQDITHKPNSHHNVNTAEDLGVSAENASKPLWSEIPQRLLFVSKV